MVVLHPCSGFQRVPLDPDNRMHACIQETTANSRSSNGGAPPYHEEGPSCWPALGASQALLTIRMRADRTQRRGWVACSTAAGQRNCSSTCSSPAAILHTHAPGMIRRARSQPPWTVTHSGPAPNRLTLRFAVLRGCALTTPSKPFKPWNSLTLTLEAVTVRSVLTSLRTLPVTHCSCKCSREHRRRAL